MIMSRFPCEYCHGTGVRRGERYQFSDEWEPDEPCTCTTSFTAQELILISRLIVIEEGKLFGEGEQWQPVGMRDELWEQLLDKIREGHKADR